MLLQMFYLVLLSIWVFGAVQLVEGTKVIGMQLEYASEYAIKLKWS